MICWKCGAKYVESSDSEIAAQYACPDCLETPEEMKAHEREEKLHAATVRFILDTSEYTHSEKLYGLSKWWRGYAKFLWELVEDDDRNAKNAEFIAMSLKTLSHDIELLENN